MAVSRRSDHYCATPAQWRIAQAHAAKRGIISGKSRQRSRLSARRLTRPSGGAAPGLPEGSGFNPTFKQVNHAHHPDQPTEVFHAAIAQMHFPIDVRQQGADGTGIEPGDFREDIPIDLLKPQTGGKPIEPYRSRQWPGQPHVEPPCKRVDLQLMETTGFHYSTTCCARHTPDTPLPNSSPWGIPLDDGPIKQQADKHSQKTGSL